MAAAPRRAHRLLHGGARRRRGRDRAAGRDAVAASPTSRATIGRRRRHTARAATGAARRRARQQDSSIARGARVARLELARLSRPPVEACRRSATAGGGRAHPVTRALADATRAHPELRAIVAERRRARAGAGRARRSPSRVYAGLGGGAARSGDLRRGYYCVGPRGGIGFDLPVFNLNGGPIARAQAETRLADSSARRSARIETASARPTRVGRGGVRARLLRQPATSRRDAVESMAREGFSAGKTGLLPLIEAQRALLDSRLGRTEARFAVQAARADLEVPLVSRSLRRSAWLVAPRRRRRRSPRLQAFGRRELPLGARGDRRRCSKPHAARGGGGRVRAAAGPRRGSSARWSRGASIARSSLKVIRSRSASRSRTSRLSRCLPIAWPRVGRATSADGRGRRRTRARASRPH